MPKQSGQIHRFRERIALYVGKGPEHTKYLTPKQARKIARELIRCAQSVEREEFTESTFRTVEFDVGED